jgi:hypothetical protein
MLPPFAAMITGAGHPILAHSVPNDTASILLGVNQLLERNKLLAPFLFLLCLVATIPVWTVARLPLLDYPNHLARAFVLAHLNDPQYQFAQFFRADWGLYPYIGMDALLVFLQRFASIETSGRIFLSLCVIALPMSILWFLRRVNPGHDGLAFFSLFLTYDLFLLQGFLNFKLSVAACFFIVGLWVWYSERPSLWRWILLLFCVTATYFIHLIGFALTGFLIFFYLIFSDAELKAKFKSFVQLALLFLPGAVLFLISRPGLGARHEMEFRPLPDKIMSAFVVPIHGFSAGFDNLFILLLIVCVFVACWENPNFKWNGAWPLVLPALFATYWLLPQSWGQTFDIDIRFLPPLLLVLLATASVGSRQKYLTWMALLLFTLRLFNVSQTFRDDQKLLAGMSESFSVMRPGAKILPIVESGEDEDQLLRPYAHYWAYAVIQRGAFSPYLFDIQGQTPLRMTADPYAPDDFWDLEYKDPPEWADVREDYDYVWAYKVPRFSTQLKNLGDLVYQSGDLSVYQVRKSTTPPRVTTHRKHRVAKL